MPVNSKSLLSSFAFAAAASVALISAASPGLAGQATRTATRAVSNAVSQVTLGEGGSHIRGNPAARVKVTEYVSYTCPHCAVFSQESEAPLNTRYVAPGRVKVEVRHLVRDPIDMAMAIAANCGPTNQFFSRHTALMRQQTPIMARVQALPEATFEQWRALPAEQRMRRVADDAGVTAWMRTRGVPAAQINSCFADVALQQRLVQMTNGAITAGVEGTPSFMVNGQLQANIHGWSALATAIDRALAAR